MIKVTQEMDFMDIWNMAWGQAKDILEEIYDADKEEELMNYLEEGFPDEVDRTELNDLLAYDWEWVYSQIGMPIDDDDEEEED